MGKTGYRVGAILFDFDGTLTRPGAIDFKQIKSALACPVDHPVLEFIAAMDDAGQRRAAMDKLHRFEMQAAEKSRPNPGAQEIVAWLKHHHLPMGIITRNSRQSVLRSLENFETFGADDFDVIVTRDDPPAPKPSGDGVRWAAKHLHAAVNDVLMVGDYIFDPQAGQAAGALTVLLDPLEDDRLGSVDCDFRIRHLNELQPIVTAGLSFAGDVA